MWLRVLSGADAGRTVELPEADRPFILGRVQGCDLVLRDERASRQHAELRVEPGGGLRIVDLGSANGTFVDGRRVEEALLAGGEELVVGGVEIAVLARRPASEGGEAPAPSWSTVGRLVDSGTRAARRVTWIALGAAVVALIAVTVLLATRGDGDEVTAAVRKVAPATVLIEAQRGDRRTGTGSGWVLDAQQGLVVTAAHVINQGERFAVGGRPASIVGVAPCEDLAVLKVPGGKLTAARLGEGSGLEQGETVVALGFPAGATPEDSPTSTRGVVSAPRTTLREPSPDVPAYRGAVQTDTALNPGFSGGPLADRDGRVVGINAAARTMGADGRSLEGQNFAIGIDRARPVLDRLRRGESAKWTGATFGYPTTEELVDRKLPPGLYITGAIPESPAAGAGVAGRGEVLAGIDGRRVGTTLESYCDAMAGKRSGETVMFTLVRPGGKRREVEVELA